MIVNKRKGYRIVFLISLLFSIYTFSMLFLFFQAKNINKFLSEDFRIIVALSKNSKQDVIQNISNIKGVKNSVFVSSDELMKRLEKEDIELYLSIKSLSKNPVPDIVEVEIDSMYLGSIELILNEISKINGVEDIRYRPDEIIAIMHSEFYSRFLLFVFGMSFFIIFLMIVFSIIHVGFGGFVLSLKESSKWFLNGVGGGFLGMIFVYLILLPLKYITPIWSWFKWYYSISIILSCGFIGWVFYQWKKD
ncbi:MAG: permease-like cell division protein FtsX [Elusimicrobiales bacterium]|nr:permease-like cell division protein FtsX [Elusimicrobiales bacterium]